MVFPELNGTLVGENLAELLVYSNVVTNGYFAMFLVLGFFLTVTISSMLMQLRFTTRVNPETSLLAGSFATLGWAIILEQYSGILNPIYFFFIVGVLILSLIWNAIAD